jgi:hypothetical protein
LNQIVIPAGNSTNLYLREIYLDANVIINYMRSGPGVSNLDLLKEAGQRVIITSNVDAEISNNLTGQEYAAFSIWMYTNYGANAQPGQVIPYPTNRPVDRNQGELSIVDAVLQEITFGRSATSFCNCIWRWRGVAE